MDTEKVYITRDEGSDWIWIWRKPSKGIWAPQNISKSDKGYNWQRPDRNLEGCQAYLVTDFRTKFGTTIREKTKKFVELPVNLLNSDDYQLISKNSDRKK